MWSSSMPMSGISAGGSRGARAVLPHVGFDQHTGREELGDDPLQLRGVHPGLAGERVTEPHALLQHPFECRVQRPVEPSALEDRG